MTDIIKMLEIFDVKPDADNQYRSGSLPDEIREVVDGSQILGQSIVVASKTCKDKVVKSAHIIFSRAASTKQPLEFDVQIVHNGRSFATLLVFCRQGERVCTVCTLLLDNNAPDIMRHTQTTDFTPPEQVSVFARDSFYFPGREIRIKEGEYNHNEKEAAPAEINAWLRYSAGELPQHLHQAVLAHFTGHLGIATAMRPNAGVCEYEAHRTVSAGNLAITISFHDPIDINDWNLYAHTSPFSGRGLVYARADIFNQHKGLAASFTLEGMCRAFQNENIHNKVGDRSAL